MIDLIYRIQYGKEDRPEARRREVLRYRTLELKVRIELYSLGESERV